METRLLLSSALVNASTPFEWIDEDGDRARLRLRGPGAAMIEFEQQQSGATRIRSIELVETSFRRSSLQLVLTRVAAGDGLVSVGSLDGGSIASLRLSAAVFGETGIALTGSVGTVSIGGLADGADLLIDGGERVRIDLGSINATAQNHGQIRVGGVLKKLTVRGGVNHADLRVIGAATNISLGGVVHESSIEIGGALGTLSLRQGGNGFRLNVSGTTSRVDCTGTLDGADLSFGDDLKTLSIRRRAGLMHNASSVRLRVDGTLHNLTIDGQLTNGSIVAASDGMGVVQIKGDVSESMILSGAALTDSFALSDALFGVANIATVTVGGDVVNSVIAAGGDPADDARFAVNEFLDGGTIRALTIGGLVVGYGGIHVNPGIYASTLGRVRVNGIRLSPGKIAAGIGALGTAVIDPLPTPANALAIEDIEQIIARAAAEATRLGVNATISITDREGNLLATVRMTDGTLAPAEMTVDIDAGGIGGLEVVDGVISTSIIAATKAGTAAFLSTSEGNAFTTRTAGQIIQRHFPPDAPRQDGGPLFGVQLSSLPTSDVNRLPLGLSGDPGGLPLYRGGELIGGIGVEIDGVYTVDPTGIGRAATDEERVALAGQSGLTPPRRIRADNILVDGIRLDYANASPPQLSRFENIPTFDELDDGDLLDILFAPRTSPASKFAVSALTRIGGADGAILGEVPDNPLYDFFDNGTGDFTFLSGDDGLSVLGAPVVGTGLTAEEVEQVLAQGHQMGERLRAQIRRDRPQVARVTVVVVDVNGNLLGAFRSLDAPVFGYDVAVQKARSAAFFSRPDAGAQLVALDSKVDVSALEDSGATVGPDPFSRHVEAAAALNIMLDGSLAMANRTIGFLARPNLPDGIDGASPGPFSVIAPGETFSPFNTGLQTQLILPQLVEFLQTLGTLSEADGLAAFANGSIGGGGVVPLDSNAGGLNPGGGLPGNSLANGLQIFAGSVPLYRDGVLIGAVGVSGDGIEQDDYVAFAAAGGDARFNEIVASFQDFPLSTQRADAFKIRGGIRLPYVKLPRSPFAGR